MPETEVVEKAEGWHDTAGYVAVYYGMEACSWCEVRLCAMSARTIFVVDSTKWRNR